MASFSMPLAHQAWCKWQATEDQEYEIETQEAMDGLHSGKFNSIWAAATALSRKLMYILQYTAITCTFLVEYLIEYLTCCLPTGFIVVILMWSLKLFMPLSLGVTRCDWPKPTIWDSICHVSHSFLRAITSPTSSSLSVFNSWSYGKSAWTIFSHPSWQWVSLCSIVDRLSRSGAKLIFRINRKSPHSLIVRCSYNVNDCIKRELRKWIKGEQRLKLTKNGW